MVAVLTYFCAPDVSVCALRDLQSLCASDVCVRIVNDSRKLVYN